MGRVPGSGFRVRGSAGSGFPSGTTLLTIPIVIRGDGVRMPNGFGEECGPEGILGRASFEEMAYGCRMDSARNVAQKGFWAERGDG